MKRVMATFTTDQGPHEDSLFETQQEVMVRDDKETIVVWEKRENEDNQFGYGYPFVIIPTHHLLYLLVEDINE